MVYHIKQNDTFDLVKFILAIFVAAIHLISFDRIGVVGKLVFPVLRTAVPLFFMISAYFFFDKINRTPKESHLSILRKTLLRNTELYLFWLIVLFYEVNNYRGYFKSGFLNGLKVLVWEFLFGTTFTASWYIMATIIGLAVIYGLSRMVSNKWLLAFGGLAYTLCVLMTNYGNLPLIREHIMWPVWKLPLTWVPYNSFPVSFLWLAMGKCFADNKEMLYLGKKSAQLLSIFAAGILLYVEQFLIIKLHSDFRSDCYFMLVPLCGLIFSLILHLKLVIHGAKKLRAFSTITFCLHATLAETIVAVLSKFGLMNWSFRYSVLKWFAILVLCGVATLMILGLERRKGFRWLRFAH